MALLSTKIFSDPIIIILGKFIFTGVVFLPTLALHFAVQFLKHEIRETVWRDLKLAYLLTFIFLILLWCTDKFIIGTYNYSWGAYPKGGPLHMIHSIFVLATALYAIFILYQKMTEENKLRGKTKRYYEIKYAFLAFLLVTCASTDLLQNWGIDFFPLGNAFVTLFVLLITYAIFKHELLGISIVIKNSLIYSILLSIITAIYFLLVFFVGHFIGDVTKLRALPLVLSIFILVTFILKPIEQYLQRILDKRMFKSPRDVIERELEQMKVELQKQDRLKAVATLAAGMAHEIKNPLTSIRTFAEYLPVKYDDPEFRKKFSKIVVDEVDRVNNIVKQLLEFSKPEELRLKASPLTPILDETLGLLSNNLLSKKIEVMKNYESNPALLIDTNQMKQVFLNIFLNSIQAMPNGGMLVIRTFISEKASSANQGDFIISISDTGHGVSKEDLSHIFDPFFTTKESGTGLGLSIVHGIITKHGGKIEVKSEKGKGTKISVILKNRS